MDIQPLLDWLHANPNWVLASVCIIAFIESLALAGIIVPGVALLFGVAVVAGNIGLAIEQVLIAGFIGAALGDGISYYLGYIFRDRLDQIWPFTRYPKAIATGKNFFLKHGALSVVVGRFIGPIRPVIPIVAGMFGMSQLRFLTFNLLSAVAWSPVYLLPGYLTGTAAQLNLPEYFLPVTVAIILAITCITLLFRYLNLKLQIGNEWYDALQLKKEGSPLFKKIWRYLTRQGMENSEFPLASLVLLFFTSCFFCIWTVLTLHTSWLKELDTFLFQFFTTLRNEILDPIYVILTLAGNEAFLYCSFTIFVVTLLIQKQAIVAIHVAVAGLSAAFATHSLKAWFAIQRPELTLLPPESYAYPSGHSSGAAVFYGLVAAHISHYYPPSNRWKIYLSAAAPIVLIAMSRVGLGVHWFSDIIGGIALGLVICAITRVSISRYQSERHSSNEIANRNRKISIAAFVLWAAALGSYEYLMFAETLSHFSQKG